MKVIVEKDLELQDFADMTDEEIIALICEDIWDFLWGAQWTITREHLMVEENKIPAAVRKDAPDV